MNQNDKTALTLADFGTADLRVERAVRQIRAGGGVIVVADGDRGNQGDILHAAETLSAQQMNLLVQVGFGIVSLVLTEERARALDLPVTVPRSTARHGTALTVSIEAKAGVSSIDRVNAIRAVLADESAPSDLAWSGLRAHPADVLELLRLAGRKPLGVLCAVMNEDGTVARLPDLLEFAWLHAMPVVTIEDLVACAEQRVAA